MGTHEELLEKASMRLAPLAIGDKLDGRSYEEVGRALR